MPVHVNLITEDRDRPALVLVHGLGSAGTIWKSLIPQLLPHFSVVTVDLPGHGDAPIDSADAVDPKFSQLQLLALLSQSSITHRCMRLEIRSVVGLL
jgi:pimeloyl-ACP methyl ester carboxylesterase